MRAYAGQGKYKDFACPVACSVVVALRVGLVPTGIARLGSLPYTDFEPPLMVRWALPTMQPATGPGATCSGLEVGGGCPSAQIFL